MKSTGSRNKRSLRGAHSVQHLIDSRRLFYFSEVAKMGSFTAAEATLDIAQSTLSRQIQQLEDELGAALLLRESRGVTLTHAGELLLAQAESIIRDMGTVREEISMARSGIRGRVTIAAPRPFSTRYLPTVVQQFSEKFPDTKLTILEASSGHLHQYLADSIVDLAVVLHNPNSKKINTKKIFTEPLFLVMRHDHPLSNEQNISRENLDSIKDLILPAALHGTRFVIERYLQDGNIDLDSTIRTDSVSLMRGLISQGRGCALLPYMACPDRLRTGEFVAKPMRPILQRTLYLARLRDRDLSQEAMAMEAEIFSVVEKNEIDEYWKADDG